MYYCYYSPVCFGHSCDHHQGDPQKWTVICTLTVHLLWDTLMMVIEVTETCLRIITIICD